MIESYTTMSKEKELVNSISFNKKGVKLNISVISFVEEKTHIVFCPALDMSGYGTTEDEAFESLKVSIKEYLDYTLKKSLLSKTLQSWDGFLKRKPKYKLPA